MLTKFQFHCSITCRHILYFGFWLPYCHTLWRHQYLICIIQKSWISLKRDEIWQKGKGLSNSPIFQYLSFSFHRHFNKRQYQSCFGLFYFLSREFWVYFGKQQHGLLKTERLSSSYPTWRQRSNSEWPNRVTHFGVIFRSQNVSYFSLLHSDKVFGFKFLFRKYLIKAIFSEQSCLTSMHFLLKRNWRQDRTLFPLLNPACKEIETCSFLSPGPTSSLSSVWLACFTTTSIGTFGLCERNWNIYDDCDAF